MKRLVFRRIGDYWFLDVADPFEPLPPQIDEQRPRRTRRRRRGGGPGGCAPERVPPIDNHAYGLWQPEAPPPDRSWVTTEDIGFPKPTRPSPMRPAEGGVGFWFSAVLGVVAFAVFIVLIVGTLP